MVVFSGMQFDVLMLCHAARMAPSLHDGQVIGVSVVDPLRPSVRKSREASKPSLRLGILALLSGTQHLGRK